jgi:hypothetical protein
MTNMRQYLAWIKQNQQNNPEWQAANRWQNRNQTPIKNEKPKDTNGLPEGTEIVEEKPEE